MAALRSDRIPAFLLLLAAAIGLVLANSPWAEAALAVQQTHFGPPGTAFDLSVGHWISDGLLAVFFFTVAVELQYELTRGELRSARRAVQPAIAAAGGVLVPIAVYLAITTGSPAAGGWPIPTATDIAFALGVLAVFGRGLPSGVRIFLLALAILDDIVGIVFIAVLFATDLNPALLALALGPIVGFAILSRTLGDRSRAVTVAIVAAMIVMAVAAWMLVLAGGVHATIAGVALGLSVAQGPGMRANHALAPSVNGGILPVFALSAALVPIPDVRPAELSPAFWGILVALPVGKLIGIAGAGWLAQRLFAGPAGSAEHPRLAFGDLLAAGALGGIGFTVSLLLAQLAFAGDGLLADEAVLGVLAGSLISLAAAGVLVSWRAWHHRRILRTQ